METGIRAKQFQEPLLLVLGELTNWRAGVPVEYHLTYEPILKRMGIPSMDTHGVNEASGQPKVAKWIQWANKALQEKSWTTPLGRGKWALTPQGLTEASRIGTTSKPKKVDPVQTQDPEPDVAPTVDDSIPYHPDPYIRMLAVQATPCYGHFSEKSAVCGTCPIRTMCLNFLAADLSQIAAILEKEDRKGKPASTAPDTDTSERQFAGSTPATNLRTIKGVKSRVSLIENQRVVTCEQCKQPIGKGDQAWWVRPSNDDNIKGMFHKDCLNVT